MSPSPLRHPARLAGASLLRLQSDERLAELAAAGHEAAFDAIVDRYRTPLTRYCAGIVGPSRADDAVQQTLINAHDALKRTDEVRHLRSWLYRIAHNAALNVLRAVRDDVSLDAASGAATVAEDGPAAAFERSERFQATVAALQELPERQRAALVLRELEGRSHEEIAETLGVTKGSARQHLMRARVALRTAVTAITPYPLIVRLAEALAGPSSAGWTDAAVGAGAGATLAKLTAGVVATGALVGGAVGTERVVHHRHTGQDAAERSSAGSATKARLVKAGAVSFPAAAGSTGSSATTGPGGGGAGSGSRHGHDKDDKNGRHDRGRGRGHDGSSGSGSGGRGSDSGGSGSGRDDQTSDSGSDDHGGRSGSSSSSGSGGSGNSSGRGSGSHGGSKDSDGSDGSESGSSSSGRSSGGSGSSGGSSGSGSSSSNGGSGGGDSSSSGSSGGGSSGRGSSGSSGADDSSGSGRGSSDDASGATTPTATAPTPTVAPPPPTTTTTDSGGRGSGSDDSGSSDHSGSN
ncbi:sigma-70 family RNA polymerase sigma factor [Baekduia sp.]|uniref:RNA polymerase sigma factor n=1 Tax=Baekduia sp. TaxID=2600305 RepID=UPI002E036AE3|nr:sigma-70 family RNA polymerase sigma factor [Baekduia sp.]